MDYEKFSKDGIGNIEDQEKALRVKEYTSHIQEILTPLTGEDWAEIKGATTQVESVKEEEEQAVASTIDMLLSLRDASSNTRNLETLSRFAKSSRIIEAAIARNFYRDHTLTKHDELMKDAVRSLYNALGEVSNADDIREAAQLTGAVMNESEMNEAMERAKKLNIG